MSNHQRESFPSDAKAELVSLRARVAELEQNEAELRSRLEVLTANEAELSTVLRAAPLGIGIATRRVLGWTNRRLQEMVGRSAEELNGASARILYPSEEEFERVGRIKHKAVRERGVGSIETHIVSKEGRRFDVILSSAAIDPDDWDLGLVFAVEDVTAWRSAERSRQLLFELSTDLLAVVGHDGYLKDVNQSWTRVLGWSREELLTRPWVEFAHPEDREPTEAVHCSLHEGCPISSFEMRCAHKEGGHRWLSWTATPTEGLIFGVARDVTRQRKMKEERDVVTQAALDLVELPLGDDVLRLSVARLARVAPRCHVGLAVLEEDELRPLEMHLSGVENHEVAEVLRTASVRCLPPLREHLERGALLPFEGGFRGITTDPMHQTLVRLAKQLGVVTTHIMGLRRGERVLGAIIVLAPDDRPLEGRALFEALGIQAAVALDRHLAEKALRRQEEQLRQAQKMEAIGSLAGGVAHDFNNLLTAILGCTAELGLQLEPTSAAHETLRVIETAGTRAAALTRQLLNFARKSEPTKEPVEVEALVRDTADVLRRTVDKRITIRIGPPREPVRVLGDASQLAQVLLNLGTNAVDAMPNGGVLLFSLSVQHVSRGLSCETGVVSPGDYVRIEVTDTGAGIPEQARKRVFEPFFTTKPRGKGTGLGLSVAYGIVEAHGGRIGIASSPDSGTTFTIFLPRTYALQREPTEAPASSAGRGTVLVVDDEVVVRDVAARILSRVGYQVLQAGNGASAVRQFVERRHEISLILLDVVMPQMSGRECLEQVRRVDPGIPVIIWTGHGPSSDVRLMMEMGTSGLLHKPFAVKDLANAVAAALSDRAKRSARTTG